jgi:hypothetical protein
MEPSRSVFEEGRAAKDAANTAARMEKLLRKTSQGKDKEEEEAFTYHGRRTKNAMEAVRKTAGFVVRSVLPRPGSASAGARSQGSQYMDCGKGRCQHGHRRRAPEQEMRHGPLPEDPPQTQPQGPLGSFTFCGTGRMEAGNGSKECGTARCQRICHKPSHKKKFFYVRLVPKKPKLSGTAKR